MMIGGLHRLYYYRNTKGSWTPSRPLEVEVTPLCHDTTFQVVIRYTKIAEPIVNGFYDTRQQADAVFAIEQERYRLAMRERRQQANRK